AATALILLAALDPATSRLFPPCPFRLATGLECPGCGTLRACHRLLHGDLAAAFRLNPLLLFAAALAIASVASRRPMSARWGLLLVGGRVCFGVLRTLPAYPSPPARAGGCRPRPCTPPRHRRARPKPRTRWCPSPRGRRAAPPIAPPSASARARR